ncbi:MAG: tRNA pseudouridine synthase A [Ruminococcus sp.]|nr:tRNA pseudouridine synthase A [Ruminococcus sp.]
MRNIKLTLEYDGTRYLGWQRPGKKDNSKTLSCKITDTLGRILNEHPTLYCAARTEPGVHASCQTVNFQTNSLLSPARIRQELNHYLPQDIAVLTAEEVPGRFHASLRLHSLTYAAFLHTGSSLDVFYRKYQLHHPAPLDLSAMRKAAEMLPGVHDFHCFSSGKTKKGTEKNIFDIQLCTPAADKLQIHLTGNSFLQQMPGLLLGTLLEIGEERRTPECIPSILSGKEHPGHPIPSHSIHLLHTNYEALP